MVAAKQPGQSRRHKTRAAPKRFYEQALSEAEGAELTSVKKIEGLDDEIALLRLRLRSLLSERPEDLTLMFRGVELLAKAVATRFRISKGDKNELSESLAKVVRGMQESFPDGGEDV